MTENTNNNEKKQEPINTDDEKSNGGRSSRFSICSSSCAATLFMMVYVFSAMFNLYAVMHPLTKVNLDSFEPDSFIKPLWDTEAEITMKVFLSSIGKFDGQFVKSEFETTMDPLSSSEQQTVLLWKEDINVASLSKSFLISSLDCVNDDNDGAVCTTDDNNDDNDTPVDSSFRFAKEWLDEHDKASLEDDGSILSTIQSAAGKGIESTSLLLTVGQGISNQIKSLMVNFGITSTDASKDNINNDDNENTSASNNRSNIFLPKSSPIWKKLMLNSTIYVHVVVVRRQQNYLGATTLDETLTALDQASQSHSVLFGKVDLVKYDAPSHLGKPARILFNDVAYLFRKYILRNENVGNQRPPWDMAFAKPEYNAAYEKAQQMKVDGKGYPYWKPEVAVKYLIDEDSYPMDIAQVSGMDFVRVKKTNSHPSGIAHVPALHVDEIGMTSDKYIPINETVTTLPLRISFDRSDMEENQGQRGRAKTATAGGISPARWRLLQHLSKSLESQRELGFEQSDIDDLRRLIADTNVTLLGITLLASALHMLFEFLTFKSEVSFWQNNSDLTGLSVRSLFLDMVGQFIIILYLIEQETSLLVTVTSAFGVLVAFWKCVKAAGLAIVPISDEDRKKNYSVINFLPSLLGYRIKATRLESFYGNEGSIDAEKDNVDSASDDTIADTHSPNLQTLTIEADRQATTLLGSLLLPFVIVYTIYSLVVQEHAGWYSWLVTSASSAVYAFGFVLMTPQLFLNYKMKSVAHLPWNVLVYKSLNTFIDDLFSFIIRMPTMARISCFRDDIVFFIYLYQRWLYPVDASRPVEGGGEGINPTNTESKIVTETKKNQ